MKNIKFKLLFEGDEQELQQGSYDVSAADEKLTFKTEDLHDISELEAELDESQANMLQTYFAYTGFSLYYIKAGDVIYLILYREYQSKHQIYERGYFEL
ncbi:MAG TPA: hypothetical protein VFQ50_03605 [Flavobacterium sp.]|jgi:hypothetical protein|nr:hypothetical protein [Flavobacterium sp.]